MRSIYFSDRLPEDNLLSCVCVDEGAVGTSFDHIKVISVVALLDHHLILFHFVLEHRVDNLGQLLFVQRSDGSDRCQHQ